MEIVLVGFGVSWVVELLMWLPGVWRLRKFMSLLLVAFITIASLELALSSFQLWTLVLLFLSFYRVMNLLRVIKGRIQADYLYHSSFKTSWQLISLQASDMVMARLASDYHVGFVRGSYIIAYGGIAVGIILLATTLHHLRTTKPPKPVSGQPDRDMPTLTVAIPARNETTDLEQCLQTLLTSNYPKLEIIVLDDCSQNKRTPEIIRGLAHDGVRFIAGKVPPSHWLAKNYAYKQLADEANGELLLFCGVDTRFKPDSLRLMVNTLVQKRKTMLSILPRNTPAGRWDLGSVLVQPARYAWELALPRRLFRRPPVLSTCWLISSRTLDEGGGFAAASRKAIPESYFAKRTAVSDDGYGFIQSDASMGISSTKQVSEQRATAIRTRYPQLHRRPELVALVGLAEFLALVWPLAVVVYSLANQLWPLVLLTSLGYLMEVITYSKVVNVTYRKFIFKGVWLLPFAALYDIGILNYSMWQYEFSEVIWKGRNVCIPLMRTVQGLPEPGSAEVRQAS